MSLRTPLGRVRGLGSAKGGTHHWWAQRLTAIALIPLTVWLVYAVVCMSTLDYIAVIGWLQSPLTSSLLILFVFAMFYHAQLGMQVIIEDYITCEVLKISSIILMKFIIWFTGLAGIMAILKIFLGL
jgi:succinate dehydrogenase / fumarate reductase, membrane anchor subunit